MTETMFDPDAHRVAEVRDYLKDAPADEVERVKALEAAGQARVGITEWEPKPTVEKDGSDGYDRVPVEGYAPGEPLDLNTEDDAE